MKDYKMIHVKFQSYLDQLLHAAAQININLKDAVVQAGLGDCTYYRWINSTTTPNENKARLVFDTLKTMGGMNGVAQRVNPEATEIYRGKNETST